MSIKQLLPSGAPLVQLLITDFQLPEGESCHLVSLPDPAAASIKVSIL